MANRSKTVLYVENVKEEINYFTQYNGDFSIRTGYKIRIIPARTIIDAKNMMDKERFDGLLLDMMLPEDSEKLRCLEQKEKERENLWKEYTILTDNTDIDRDEKRRKVKEIKRVLDNLDEDIEKLLCLEGGIDLVSYYIDKYDITPTLFFSARGDDSLKEKCERVIDSNNFSWIEKPATVEEVYNKFINMWESAAS